MIGYLDKATRALVWKMPKMSGYVKTLKVKDRDKGRNNKLMSFRRVDEKLLEQYKAFQNRIEELKILN